MFASLLSLALLGGQISGPTGWYRVRVDVPTPAALERLENTDLPLLDCVPHSGSTEVGVGPTDWPKLTRGHFSYTVVKQMEDPRNWQARHGTHVSFVTDDYRAHYFNADQILGFFEQLRSEHPATISRVVIGTSINGETIWAYRFICNGPQLLPGPKNVVVEGLIHAREWITGACMMHIGRMVADNLIDPFEAVQSFTIKQNVWIVPMVNPDGYRYTWTTNRLWRKNRRHNSGGSYGVDVNRNFSTGFGLNGGSSSTQSSDTYKGTAAFSEPEAQAIRTLFQKIGTGIAGFIDYHSYAQDILEPWGYTTATPPDSAALHSIATEVQQQMSAYGAPYTAGQTSHILYVASGVSNDWAYATYGAAGFGIELRDTGQYGFELPESQISVSQDEVWAGFSKFLGLVGS